MPPAYRASARARALSGLARDGEVSITDAAAAVDVAVALGEACVSLADLAQAYLALGDPARTIETIRRVPKTCFRSVLLALWRFRLWDLRARAAFDLGRISEGFRYAERIVGWMDREEQLELIWVAPYRTVQALLDLSDSERARTAVRARAALVGIVEPIDADEWFGRPLAERITAVTQG